MNLDKLITTQTIVLDSKFAYLKIEPAEIASDSVQARAVFMLHGFPGIQGDRNQDLARLLASTLKVSVYLPHYRGLGQHPGNFEFSSSIQESVAAFDSVEARAATWSFIGHSWGAFVLGAVASRIHSKRIAKALPKGKLHVLQAKDDAVVPLAVTDAFVARLGENVTYEVVDSDHSFQRGRDALGKKVLEIIG